MLAIRRATPADLPSLVRFDTAFDDARAHLWTKANSLLHARTTPASLIAAPDIEAEIVLIALLDGSPVGFIRASTGERADHRLHCDGFVDSLFVVPEARRRGIAHALLDAVETALGRAGADHFTLLLEAENRPAEQLYLLRGWCPVYVELWKLAPSV